MNGQFKTWTLVTAFALGGMATPAIAANPDQIQRLLKTNQCPRCDLRSANLENANLFGANLVGADLSGANLTGVNLGSANLTDADLTGARLDNAYLYLATLENTNFNQASLENAYLKDAILQDTRFSNANLRGVNLSRTNLVGIDLKGVDLSNANLSGATLSGVRSSTLGREFQGAFNVYDYYAGTQCLRTDSADVEYAKKYGVEIAFANLSGSKLREANLKNAVLYSGDLSGADLTRADLTGANLTCSNLTNAVLDGGNLQDAKLDRAVLNGASLNGVKNAQLQGTYKTEAELAADPAQSEAKSSIGAMGRAQQAYYLEKEIFTSRLDILGLGIKSDTETYKYRIFLYRNPKKAVMLAAVPTKAGLKSFVGYVIVSTVPSTKEATTYATICESETAAPQLPKMPATFPDRGPASCPTGFKPLSR